MKKYIWFLVLVIALVLSCETQESQKEIVDFTAIQKQFKPSTLYQSISILPRKTSVIKVDMNDFKKFQEYELKNGKWENITNYEAEVYGNVLEKDFLFTLNDSLISFVNLKKDSLQKIGKVEGLKIGLENYFYGSNQLTIEFLVNENMRDKRLFFNY